MAENGWVLADLEQVTAEEYDAFMDSLSASPKLGATTPYLRKWIMKWPFEGDPTKEESYGKLKLKEWRAAIKAVTAGFRGVMAAD